jgi:hypothetical protein
MNKILIRVIILVLIAGLAILLLLKVRSPFGKNNSSFASEPEKEITGIDFSQNGKKLNLSKNGETWILNGKTEVRKSGINFILRVLSEIKIKSPVSPELFSTEIAEKKVNPVKVKVYEKGKVLKSFLVYKTNSNIYGNVMKIRESSKPFIVYVPGYEGDIGSGFILNELFWQPYTVFNYLPSEILSVKFENMSDTAASFTITNRNRHYFINGDEANKTGWDSSLVYRYISYFARVPFESWAFDISETEQKNIENKSPLYRITVTGTLNRKTVLTLWKMAAGNEVDSDRLLGKTEDRDNLFIIRYFDIDPLIKKREYFFRE